MFAVAPLVKLETYEFCMFNEWRQSMHWRNSCKFQFSERLDKILHGQRVFNSRAKIISDTEYLRVLSKPLSRS